jgi:hypothetical protein
LTASTFGLTRLSAGSTVLMNEFTIYGEYDSALARAEVAIGPDRISDARGTIVAQLLDQEVSERTRERTRTSAQGSFGPCDSLGCWRGLAAQPLRDGGRRELHVTRQVASRHTSVLQRLPQGFAKGFPLLGCGHWSNAPLSVLTGQQACPIRQRPVEGVALQLTPDSYQATVVSVAGVLAHHRDSTPNEGARPYGSAATDDSCGTEPACTAGGAHDACAAGPPRDYREGSRVVPRCI